MSDAGKAVFLSYASQDAEAAKRICEALRAAGVEVWFDQSELVGGDAWDQKIRKQIRDCALLIPVISKNTQARAEGYFRLEWRLADQRTHLMGKSKAFLLPLTIDGTVDADADVPDSFLAVQWTKAPGGEVPPGFVTRVQSLLNVGTNPPVTGGARPALVEGAGPGASSSANRPGSAPPATGMDTPRRRKWVKPVVASAALVIVALGITMFQRSRDKLAVPALPAAGPSTATAERSPQTGAAGSSVESLSPARKLLAQAEAIGAQDGLTQDNLAAREALCARALALDDTDAAVWAAAAEVDATMIEPMGYDLSEERRRLALSRSARALALDSTGYQTRRVRAHALSAAGRTPALRAEAEKILRQLLVERPDAIEVRADLATLLRQDGRPAESAAEWIKLGQWESAGWSYYLNGDYRRAMEMLERAPPGPRSEGWHLLTSLLELVVHEDLEAAQASAARIPANAALQPAMAAQIALMGLLRRDPEQVLNAAKPLTADYHDMAGWGGPRHYWIAWSHALAGRTDEARVAWTLALKHTQTQRQVRPDRWGPVLWEAYLQACLDRTEEAKAELNRLIAVPLVENDWRLPATYMRLGMHEQAISWIERQLKARATAWEWIHALVRFSPEFDAIRSDPRIQTALRDYLPPLAKPMPVVMENAKL